LPGEFEAPAPAGNACVNRPTWSCGAAIAESALGANRLRPTTWVAKQARLDRAPRFARPRMAAGF